MQKPIQVMARDIHAQQQKWWYTPDEKATTWYDMNGCVIRFPTEEQKVHLTSFTPHHRQMVDTGWAKLALIMTEISEFSECAIGGKDDKLTQYEAVLVELADILIRTLDYACGCKIEIDPTLYFSHLFYEEDEKEALKIHLEFDADIDELALHMFRSCAHLIETERKNSHDEELRSEALNNFIAEIFETAAELCLEETFYEIIQAKIDFNSVRPDHKFENRMKEGGKSV